MVKAIRKHKRSPAGSTEQQAPFDPAEWIPWHKARELGANPGTANRELDAARRAGDVRTLARYSAPDGTVEWRQPPADLKLVNTLAGGDRLLSDEWRKERRKRGGDNMVFVHRADVGRLWPSAEQADAARAVIDSTGTILPSRRGGQFKYDWDLITAEVFRRVYEDGLPATGGNSKLADDLVLWCDKVQKMKLEEIPQSDSIQRKLRIWLSRVPRGK
jgi:hypothetical protein